MRKLPIRTRAREAALVCLQQSRAHKGAGPPAYAGGSGSVIVGALRNEAVPEDRARRPWAYLITFSCYGTKLHGRQSGSVDRNHNAWKGRYLDPSRSLRNYEHGLLKNPPTRLDAQERRLVLKVIKNVCFHEGRIAHAVQVRTNHVHLVVAAEINPAALMGKLKAYASRALNSSAGRKVKRWTRHGSLAWLWEPHQVDTAVYYVVRQQGYPMAVFENLNRWDEHTVVKAAETKPKFRMPAPEPLP